MKSSHIGVFHVIDPQHKNRHIFLIPQNQEHLNIWEFSFYLNNVGCFFILRILSLLFKSVYQEKQKNYQSFCKFTKNNEVFAFVIVEDDKLRRLIQPK
jgi:hypothetical protein